MDLSMTPDYTVLKMPCQCERALKWSRALVPENQKNEIFDCCSLPVHSVSQRRSTPRRRDRQHPANSLLFVRAI